MAAVDVLTEIPAQARVRSFATSCETLESNDAQISRPRRHTILNRQYERFRIVTKEQESGLVLENATRRS